MPSSSCCECDRPAVRHWGVYAYCLNHLEIARQDAPQAHQCPVCHVEQPPHVSWHGRPCGSCAAAAASNSIFPAGSRAGLHDPKPMPTTTDQLADLLLEFGVDLGEPAARAQKASLAFDRGVLPEQARAVFEHVERTAADPDRVPALIAKLIMDPDRLKRTAEDVARFLEIRKDRTSSGAAKRKKGDPVHPSRNPYPWVGCSCEECCARRAAGQPDHLTTRY